MHSLLAPRFNSALAFVLAGMLATTTHEAAHFAMALVLHEKPTMFPIFVNVADNVSLSHLILIAATGPLFSLVSGLLIIVLTREWAGGFVRLCWLWFGFLSAQIGFGYFFAAVISQTGDTGFVLAALHAPWYVFALVFLIGAGGSWVILPRLFTRRVSPLVPDKQAFNQVGMYPWLLGTGVLLVVYFIIGQVIAPGNIDPFGLLAVLTIGIFTPIANFDAALARRPHGLAFSSPIAGMVLTVVVALVLIFGLAHGLSW